MQPQTSGYTAEAFRKAFNDHAVDAILGLYAPGATIEAPTLPEKIAGHDQIREYFNGIFHAWPDITLEHIRILAAEDCLITEWICRGTHKGNFIGMPATNRFGQVKGVSITRIRDRKAIEDCVYFDRLTVLHSLGLKVSTE